MKLFSLVFFSTFCFRVFCQDYIQRDSTLTTGMIYVIDDQSFYFKKYKKDRYVRLSTSDVYEYRTKGKIFQSSAHDVPAKFYRVGGKSGVATVLLLKRGYLLKMGDSSEVILSKTTLINKLRERLDAPPSSVPDRAFNMPRALSYNIEKIIFKEYRKLLFPRFSVVTGVLFLKQKMVAGALPTAGGKWEASSISPFVGVRYQKPFFTPQNIFLEVQTNFFTTSNSLKGAFNEVNLSGFHALLPVNIVWQKQFNNVSPFVKGGVIGAYQTYSSPKPIS
ncbi:MAG: hypothetical protein ACKO96_08495, partial [Flammeovirgaceae bacterium]